MAGNARVEAVKILQKLHLSHAYSHIVLDNALQTADLTEEDRAFLSRLVFGVEERRLTIDHMLSKVCDRPLSRLHPLVLEILRVGAYQLLFTDRIPPSAAVNEAVKSARLVGQSVASGFVNGVLRGLSRKAAALWDELGETADDLAIRHSCPSELIALWQEAYGEAETLRLLEAINAVPPVVLRLNTLKTTREEWAAFAAREEIAYTAYEGLPDSVVIADGISRKKLAKFEDGWYYQDGASQLAIKALGPHPGETVADVCSAPGGKSFTAAMTMQNKGRIVSGDVHGEKCDIVATRARKLGISIIETVARDASKPCPKGWVAAFDRVMCDVPCSGYGVIRRKPEIRYKLPSEFAKLPILQYRILEEAAKMVRPGGVLQYSTCTLRPQENERVVTRFLEEHPEFSPRILPLDREFALLGKTPHWHITLFPSVHQTDGFFIAGFCRREETV